MDGVLRIFSTNPPPPPVFSGAAQTDGNLVFTATNGIPYDPCCLQTTTNLVTPVWLCCATNRFNSDGMVNFTNVIAPGEPQRYFRMQVN
ncbi:MAG: hypothetical protein ABSB84_04585 [Verrucomicrobiota bacterium]